MKKQICITVDIENLNAARDKIENVSEYLNECLKGLTEKSVEEQSEDRLIQEIKVITSTINELQIKKTVKELDLKLLVEQRLQKAQELMDREESKRWLCPVCKKNKILLSSNYCENCRLRTRPKDESKLQIVYLNEVLV